MTREAGDPGVQRSARGGPQGATSLTRGVALAVLVPAVPLLLLSVAALAVFYAAPERFGRLLERLPGTEFLRVALMFAPATLMAVVVMAVLYARDQGQAGEIAAAPRPGPVPSASRLAARLVLVLIVPLLAVSAAALVLSLAAPGRFAALISGLPGQSHLRALLPFAPFVLLFVGLIASSFALGGGEGDGPAAGRRPPGSSLTRLAVGLVLVPALPLLGMSLAGLALFYLEPHWAERVLAHLGTQAVLRLALLFAPAALIALVIVAALYLRQAAAGDASRRPAPSPAGRQGTVRERLAAGVLIFGLGATTAAGLGLIGAIAYLLMR